jgi:glycerophosphoryl diester phosphodiesterase
VHLLIFLSAVVLTSSSQFIPKFDLQGHRGARGLKPENTVPAFIQALENGVTTLELDVVITKDKQVMVSHEPWMSADICLQPDSSAIPRGSEMKFNIYQLNYEEVQKFDCGSKGNVRFPEQQKMKIGKPLLTQVIIAVENHIKSFTQYEVDYNIEIKTTAAGDNKFHPAPQEFSDLVYNTVNQYLPWERIVIQSFDPRVLKYWHTKYPHVRLALLVENRKSPETNLNELGFLPSVYSPLFTLLSETIVRDLKQKKIRIIPWTINEPEDMKRMKSWGVDGIITDYPNRAAELGFGLKGKEMQNGKPKE